MQGQILVAGSVAYDYIMDFPGEFKDHILPDKLHIINISFLVPRLKKQRGGCSANIAYTMALLGEHPRVVAAAGRDFPEYAAWLTEQGVDVGGVKVVDDEITATCFITTDKGDNQITGFYMGAMVKAPEISLKAVAGPNARICVVAPDAPEAMLRHCREAREARIPVVYDPSFQVTAMEGEKLWEGTLGAKALILNDYEYAVFGEKTGKSTEEVMAEVEILVVTLGEHGSRIHQRGREPIEVPAAKISGVVDPTGAGDAFRGGFVTGLVRGYDMAVCGRMGSVTAAYAVEQYGTQNHRYTYQDFLGRYEENFGAAPPALREAQAFAR